MNQILPNGFTFRGQEVHGLQYVAVQDVVLALTHALPQRPPAEFEVLQKLRDEIRNLHWSRTSL